MTPEFSRRVAQVMHVKPIVDLDIGPRLRFIRAVLKADTFDDLPERYQNLIILAEANRLI